MKSKTSCWIGLILAGLFVSGCASSSPMALNEGKGKLNPGATDAIVLLTVKVSKETNRDAQPCLVSVWVARKNPEKSHSVDHYYIVGKPTVDVSKQYNEYIVSIRIPGGKLFMSSLYTQNSSFWLGVSQGYVPLNMNVNVEPGHVYYMGSIEANIRERLDGEVRAGPLFPLATQAASGYSNGTWDVAILDNYEKHMTMIKNLYPAVAEVIVEKRILPVWVRPTK